MLPYVARVISSLPTKPSILIEPFAGGAAVSVGLLEHNFVPRIALNDTNTLVASFWKTVFCPEMAQALAEKIRKTEVCLDRWKSIKASSPEKTVDRAFKCIFLNRTSFSGILHSSAGPIGGMAQAGTYKIDARFPKERLAARILKLSSLHKRVEYVKEDDFRDIFSDPLGGCSIKQEGRAFWYIDPPFWNKAEKLYSNFFSESDHNDLFALVSKVKGAWVLSYDNAPEILRLYSQSSHWDHVGLRYTARSRSTGARSQEILFTNTKTLRGIEGRSVAVFEGNVRSEHIRVSEVKPREKITLAMKKLRERCSAPNSG